MMKQVIVNFDKDDENYLYKFKFSGDNYDAEKFKKMIIKYLTEKYGYNENIDKITIVENIFKVEL